MRNKSFITSLKLAATSMVLFGALTGSARADYTFSGNGSSGTLVSPSETWTFNADGGAAATGYLNDWGSPGVGLGITTYGEPINAYGMDITFTGGGTIDPASIAIGNGASCVGSTNGGTTFCTVSPTDIWEAFQAGPSTIDFRAQSSSYYLTSGQAYFVNIFFDGATPTGFTGSWVTSFAPSPTPEPSTWVMLGVGLAGLGFNRFRSRKTAN